MSFDHRETLEALCCGHDLSLPASRDLFAAVIRGELGEAALAGVLIALKAKGETPDEIAGAASAMRAAATRLDTGDLAVADCCGTGGDGMQTVNISTAAAIVAAAAGVAVAKHGNRAVSSRCGSADLLEAAGVCIDAPPERSRRCLDRAGICFLLAPQYHAGIRHAMPVRNALRVRTIFNLLGPLANPAQPRWQLMGVYDPARCSALAETLALLGCERALVVHGAGLDEVALHDATAAALLDRGQVRRIQLTPEDAGLSRQPIDELRGGDPADNARWLEALLQGCGTMPHRYAVALNAGALLWICDKAADLRDGTAQALALLDSGKAAETLHRWREASRGA